MTNLPKFENAPGHVVRRLKNGWVVRWQARWDLIQRGFAPASARLWSGVEPSELDRAYISDRCNALQAEMLVWGRGGVPVVGTFGGTIKDLIRCYQTDADSPYRKLRWQTRRNYDMRLARIEEAHSDLTVAEINARRVLRWYDEWSEGGKVAAAHGLIGMLRTLAGFGATLLEDAECERLATVLHRMRFKQPAPRNEILNADQVTAIRKRAHERGWHSLALAQALQFELMLRQRDVIGEWVPLNEPGASDVIAGNEKWLRGIRWNEIDGNLILRHVTSKRQKEIERDLKIAPMVMEELRLLAEIPAFAPLIVCESTGYPYASHEFRRRWRLVATEVGVPRTTYNMDSRAGAITEATSSGAVLDDVRQAATHSDIAMTTRYSRNDAERSAKVMAIRAANRNKPRT